MTDSTRLKDYQLDDITDEAVERAADEAVRIVELYLRAGQQTLSTRDENERGLLIREVMTPLAKEAIRYEVAGCIEAGLADCLKNLKVQTWYPQRYIDSE